MKMRVNLIAVILMLALATPAGAFQANGGGGGGGGSGVSSIIAGTGISVDHATGAVTVTNTASGGGVPCTTNTTPVAVGFVGCNTITISSAQLKALNTTPITLIAAPGAGNIIEVTSVNMTYTFGTIAYGGAEGLRVQYNIAGNGDSISPGGNSTGLGGVSGATTSVFSSTPAFSQSEGDASLDINQPVQFMNTQANYTNGDGTMKITTHYMVVAF